MRAIDVFAKIYDAPPAVRTRLLTIGIPRVLPIASGLGIRVREQDDVHAVTTMPLSRRSRNHIGSVYIGALLVQAEITMATLVVGLCRPPQFRVLVKRQEGDYPARADGAVRAVCAPQGEERDAIERCRGLVDDKGEAWASVTMESEGKTVAVVRFLVAVKHKSR